MTRINDNRMSWVRNIDTLRNTDKLQTPVGQPYIVEHEIASDSYIQGLFDYDNGKILCCCMTPDEIFVNRKGLYKYLLKIKVPSAAPAGVSSNASTKGYVFKEGILGELIALFSLYFQCRFYLVATYHGELTPNDAKLKYEHEFTHQPCQPYFDPGTFSGDSRSFTTGLQNFLQQIAGLDAKYHQHLILASYHYARALKEFGIDEEMVFIRLVSAIEAISAKWITLDKKDDLFQRKKIDEIINPQNLSKDDVEELKNIFEVRKSKLRFKRFIEYYSKGFFKGGKSKAPHLRINKANLPKILDAIYDSRSAYLHKGEMMYLSLHWRDAQRWKWDIDPSLGMIIDNREFSKDMKLPYGSFFQKLVRYCLLKFIKEKQKIR